MPLQSVYQAAVRGYPWESQLRVSRSLTIKQMAMVAAVVMVFVLSLHRFVVPSGTAKPLQHLLHAQPESIARSAPVNPLPRDSKSGSPARKPF